MADDALKLVHERNNFYRDNYRRAIAAVLLMVIINVVLVAVIFYQIATRPAPQYFATTNDGRIIPLYPLSEPIVSKQALLDYAAKAVVAAYNFDFVNYRKKLQDAQIYFTPDGWREFERALDASNNLKTVIADRLIATAVVTGTPVIQDERVVNGRYAWRIQMPVLITYESASKKIQQPVTVTLVVMRVSSLSVPRGIAIAQFYSSERSAAR